MATGAGSNARSLWLGVAAAAVVGIGVVAAFGPATEPATPAGLTAADASGTGGDVAIADVPEAQDLISDDAPVVAVQAAPAMTPVMMPPVRETFLMFPDGFATIAGRAAPNATIEIKLAGLPLERVTADAAGGFGTTVFIAPSDQPRRMQLVADPDGDAVASEETYLVQPTLVAEAPAATIESTAPAPEVVADAQPDAGPDVAPLAQEPAILADSAETAVADAADLAPASQEAENLLTDVPEQPQTSVSAPVSPVSPVVLVADADGVRVLQPASDTSPEVMSHVALDTITYDPAGEVQLSGRGAGDGSVQIYLDNQPITTSRITAQGDWQIELPDVDTGVYTLRIDQLSAQGEVVSRIETPFQREEAADVAAVFADETADSSFDVAVRTVQPGATLWAIAREQFGEGIMYVAVFEANRDRIRDPDLIYPGQIFRIPQVGE